MFAWKSLSLGGLLILSLFGLLEGGLRLYSPSQLQDEWRELGAGHLKARPCLNREISPEPQNGLEQLLVGDESLAKQAHPYFGYTYRREPQLGINAQGFRDPDSFAKRPIQDQSFRIAVFGGEIAENLAHFWQGVIDREPERFKVRDCASERCQIRKVKVFNMAVRGFRQPQQYQVATYYSDQFDLAINLDGLHELSEPREVGFPENFPIYATRFFVRDFAKLETIQTIESLVLGQRDLAQHLRRINADRIWGSALFWRSFKAYSSWRIHRLTKKVMKSERDDPHRPLQSEVDPGPRIWEMFVKKQSDLFRAIRKQSVHFIQPLPQGASTQTLRQAGTRLAAQGYLVFDLNDEALDFSETASLGQCGQLTNDVQNRVLKLMMTKIQEVLAHKESDR